MKIVKKIIYGLLGLILTGAVVMVGVILYAEYAGNRFQNKPDASQTALSDGESRLVYDEYGNIAELPGTVTPEASETPAVPETPAAASETPAVPETPAAASDSGEQTYILDKTTALFHNDTCSDAAAISEENRLTMTGSREDVIGRGYNPCTICNP